MSEAASHAARDGVDEGALAALRFGWGEAYRIGWDPVRGWWAQRRDDLGGDTENAEELWQAIRRDYDFKTVPREYTAPLAES